VIHFALFVAVVVRGKKVLDQAALQRVAKMLLEGEEVYPKEGHPAHRANASHAVRISRQG
jgi:hypothetical protein